MQLPGRSRRGACARVQKCHASATQTAGRANLLTTRLPRLSIARRGGGSRCAHAVGPSRRLLALLLHATAVRAAAAWRSCSGVAIRLHFVVIAAAVALGARAGCEGKEWMAGSLFGDG